MDKKLGLIWIQSDTYKGFEKMLNFEEEKISRRPRPGYQVSSHALSVLQEWAATASSAMAANPEYIKNAAGQQRLAPDPDERCDCPSY